MFKHKPRKPAKNPCGGGGDPLLINQTWRGDREPAFDLEIDGLLACKTTKVAHLADRLASRYKYSALARHLAGRLLEEQAQKVQKVEGSGRDLLGEALVHLRDAVEVQPHCLGIAFSLANIYNKMQRFDLAADECRPALAVGVPCDPALHAVSRPPKELDTSAEGEMLRIAQAKSRLEELLDQVSPLEEECRQIHLGDAPMQQQQPIVLQSQQPEQEADPPKKSFAAVLQQREEDNDNDIAKKFNKFLREIEPLLRHAIKTFIIELNLEEEWKKISNEPPKLEILGLPPPGSIQALAQYLKHKDNILVKSTQIHGDPDDVVVADTTELGRSLFLGFLEYIIAQHEQNKSWGGLFSIDDLQVTNGWTFEISKLAKAQATPEAMANDMKRLAELLVSYYRTAQGSLPAYFFHLESDLKECKNELGTYSSAKTMRFQKYIKAHLALKSPIARGHLFLDLYRVRQALGRNDRMALNAFLADEVFQWTALADKHLMLRKVFKFSVDENGDSFKETSDSGNKKTSDSGNKKTSTSGKKKTYASKEPQTTYGNNLEHLLIYLRHATEHGTDHTKDDNGLQKLKNLIEVDLLIATYLGTAVIDLIKILFYNSKMEADMFEGIWTEFANSRS